MVEAKSEKETVTEKTVEPKKEERNYLGKGIPTSLQIFIGLSIISLPMLFGNLPTFDLFLFFGMPIIVFLIVLIRAIFKRKKYAVPLYFIGQGIQVLFSISLLVLFAENINDYLFNIIITIAGYLFWGFFFYRNRGFFTEEGF